MANTGCQIIEFMIQLGKKQTFVDLGYVPKLQLHSQQHIRFGIRLQAPQLSEAVQKSRENQMKTFIRTTENHNLPFLALTILPILSMVRDIATHPAHHLASNRLWTSGQSPTFITFLSHCSVNVFFRSRFQAYFDWRKSKIGDFESIFNVKGDLAAEGEITVGKKDALERSRNKVSMTSRTEEREKESRISSPIRLK